MKCRIPILALLLIARASAQTLPELVQKALQKTQDTLRKSSIPEQTLSEDRASISVAYDVVRRLYELRGLNEEAAAEAIGERWGQLRAGKLALPKTSSLGPSTFTNYGLAVETATEKLRLPEYLKETAALIKMRRPGLADEVLIKDRETLLPEVPGLRSEEQQRGFSSAEAYWGVMSVWESFRVGVRAIGGNLNLAPKTFADRLHNSGLLIVLSDPSGASVAVDQEPWDDPTNTGQFVRDGQREVRITKKGCKPLPLIAEVEIKPGARNTYEGHLTCPASRRPKL